MDSVKKVKPFLHTPKGFKKAKEYAETEWPYVYCSPLRPTWAGFDPDQEWKYAVTTPTNFVVLTKEPLDVDTLRNFQLWPIGQESGAATLTRAWEEDGCPVIGGHSRTDEVLYTLEPEEGTGAFRFTTMSDGVELSSESVVYGTGRASTGAALSRILEESQGKRGRIVDEGTIRILRRFYDKERTDLSAARDFARSQG